MTTSWYVGYLLYNCSDIRDSIINYDLENDTIDIDLYDDVYSDLLSVEMIISSLKRMSLLTENEKDIINYLKDRMSMAAIANKMSLNIKTVMSIFNKLCTKIALILGENFTNDGFLDYMLEKYNITDQNIEDRLAKLIFRRESNER